MIEAVAGDEAEKQQTLARLRELWGEARDLVSTDQAFTNLEWILGVKRNPGPVPVDLDDRTIEVITLWLRDLALEIDRRLPLRPADGLDEGLQSVDRKRHSMAARLRVATEGFVMAFRRGAVAVEALS